MSYILKGFVFGFAISLHLTYAAQSAGPSFPNDSKYFSYDPYTSGVFIFFDKDNKRIIFEKGGAEEAADPAIGFLQEAGTSFSTVDLPTNSIHPIQ